MQPDQGGASSGTIPARSHSCAQKRMPPAPCTHLLQVPVPRAVVPHPQLTQRPQRRQPHGKVVALAGAEGAPAAAAQGEHPRAALVARDVQQHAAAGLSALEVGGEDGDLGRGQWGHRQGEGWG